MRIAYLSSACIPSRTANSIHVMKMCHALARAGHEVVLFAPDKADGRESDMVDPFDYYGVARNFIIEHLPWVRMKGRGYWYSWLAAQRVRKQGFDLAVGRNLSACYFASSLGLPVVYEAHSPVEDDGRLARYLFGCLVRSSSFRHMVVITDALRRHFEQVWPELKGRIVVAPDGADPLEDQIQPVDLGRPDDRMQVGYTGHLYAGKGAELVVELARACPQFDFHIVGGTREDLRRWRERDDLSDNLQLHGHQSHARIQSYLLSFDALLLPNQPEVRAHGGKRDIGRWTSPLKLFEYMAAGRAIVCSDVPVLLEVAEHGMNMLVCRHDDVGDWAAALEGLWADRGWRQSLGAMAREQLERRYSWDIRASHVLEPAYDLERRGVEPLD
ncbi:glycosyltransferase family 4 protein [Thioalkalivibrio sp. ALJ16]|uniref:glycosyltransferase family 4 protein n=1 Tax=Thioalkalivibrio sp. ALJ16 TaxID=1158762 RepID=UPI0003A5D634|nr:glycosyltransferase family 4 protein [Thioalkalivibrio sp. ALJ16]